MICEPLVGQPITVAEEYYKHLSDLDLDEIFYIDIPIGADHHWELVTGRIRHRGVRQIAIETKLGWVLSEPVPSLSFGSCSVNLISSQVLMCDRYSWNSARWWLKFESAVGKIWDLETLGIKKITCLRHVQVVHHQGRYCVKLPLKDVHQELVGNYYMYLWLIFSSASPLTTTTCS